MLFPDYRPRRLRQNDAFRRMIRETVLSVDDLILPLFTINGKGVMNPIDSMPGHYQLSIDNLVKTSQKAYELGIPAVMLFGIPDKKDSLARKLFMKLSDFTFVVVILLFSPLIIGAAGLDAVWLRQVQLYVIQFFSNWPIWMLMSVIIAGISYLLLNIPRLIIQLKGSPGTSPKKF